MAPAIGIAQASSSGKKRKRDDIPASQMATPLRDIDKPSDVSDQCIAQKTTPDCWADTTGPDLCAPAYDKTFGEIEDNLRRQAARVSDLFERHDCIRTRFEGSLQKARRLQLSIEWPRMTVLLAGGSGAGKSSLTNCVLDQPGAAKALAGGQRCTDVPAIYEAAFHDQTKAVAARVKFKERKEIERMLRDLVSGYGAWYCDVEHERDDWPKEDRERFFRKARTAFDTFNGLFGDRPQFASYEVAHHFLKGKYSDKDGAVSLFLKWSIELVTKAASAGGGESNLFEADNPAELHDLLKPFSDSTFSSDQPSLWPLVQYIRMGMNRHILKYLRLADCPGSSDTDTLRANAFARLIKDSDELWVAGGIDRIASESSPSSFLLSFGRSHIKTLVIATKSDDGIDRSLCQYLEGKSQDVEHISASFEKQAQLRLEIQSIDEEIGCREEDSDSESEAKRRRMATPLQGHQEVPTKKLRKQVRKLRRQLDDLQQQSLELLASGRNVVVANALREELREHLPQGVQLQTHCVSSAHYAATKRGLGEIKPCLSMQLTGIPGLRARIYDIMAPKILQTMHDYIDADYRIFFEGLGFHANPVSVPGHDDALQCMEGAKSDLDVLIDEQTVDFKTLLGESLRKPLMGKQNAFVQAALKMLESKRKWMWSPVKAWLLNYGRYETKNQFKHSWDQQFTERALDALEEQRENFMSQLTEATDQQRSSTVRLVKNIFREVRSSPAGQILDMKRLERYLDAQIRSVSRRFREFGDDSLHALNAIIDHNLRDDKDGHFSQAMEEAYDRCTGAKGQGARDRCLGVIEAHLGLQGERSPFAIMLRKLCDDLEAAFTEETEALGEWLFRTLDEIRSEVETMFREKDSNDAEAAMRSELTELLVEIEECLKESKKKLEYLEWKHSTPASVKAEAAE